MIGRPWLRCVRLALKVESIDPNRDPRIEWRRVGSSRKIWVGLPTKGGKDASTQK